MTEHDMRSFLSIIRRALLMICHWIDEWLESHNERKK